MGLCPTQQERSIYSLFRVNTRGWRPSAALKQCLVSGAQDALALSLGSTSKKETVQLYLAFRAQGVPMGGHWSLVGSLVGFWHPEPGAVLVLVLC